MKVFARSKNEFEDIMLTGRITDENVEQQDSAFISILSPGKVINPNRSFYARPYFERDHANVITMDFDDIVSPEHGSPFTPEMAEKTVKFIIANKDKKVFLVHCAAGISRSGAIATFINDNFGGDTEEFKKWNPQIMPNNLVLRLLYEAYEKLK